MADSCRKLVDVSQDPGCALGKFINDIAYLKGNAEELESCDLEHYTEDLKIPPIDIPSFVSEYGHPERFRYCSAADYLAGLLQQSDTLYRTAFFANHSTLQSLDALAEKMVQEGKERSSGDMAKLEKRLELFEKYFLDSKIDILSLMSFDEAEITLQSIRSLRAAFEQKKYDRLEENLNLNEARLPSVYQWINERADAEIRLWSRMDKVTNLFLRNAVSLGSGFWAAAAVAPEAAPLAMVVSGLSDLIGEEGGRVMVEPHYSIPDAGAKFLYHSPFIAMQGLGFHYGQSVGGGVFIVTSFLEGVGDASRENLPPSEWFDAGCEMGFYSMLGLLIGEKMCKIFPKRFAPMGPSYDLELRLKRSVPPALPDLPPPPSTVPSVTPAAPAVVAPVASPPPSASIPRAVVASPEPNLPGPRRYRRVENGSAEAEAPAARAQPPIRYTAVETDFAKGNLARMHPTIQKRLQIKIEVITQALNSGVPITQISGVKKIVFRKDSKANFWEGKIISPGKPRVYFTIEGNNGARTLRILGYSFGDKEQQRVLDALSKMVGG